MDTSKVTSKRSDFSSSELDSSNGEKVEKTNDNKESFFIEGGENTTLTSIINGNKDRHELKRGKYVSFFSSYTLNCMDRNQHFLEDPREIMPVVVRILMEKKREKGPLNWDESRIDNIISNIQSVINELLDVKQEEDFSCIVMISNPHIKKNIIELRLSFPRLRVETRFQSKKLFPEIVNRLDNLNIKLPLDEVFSSPWIKIINQNFSTDLYPFYGSFDEYDNENTTFVYAKYLIKQEEENPKISQSDLVSIFNTDRHLFRDELAILITTGNFADLIFRFIFFLPFILSLDGYTCQTKPKNHGSMRRIANLKNYVPNKIVKHIPQTYDMSHFDVFYDGRELDDLDLFIQLISMWDNSRVIDEIYWVMIGECIHTIYNGDSDGADLWEKVTRRAFEGINKKHEIFTEKNIFGKCETRYSTLVSRKTTIKTIAIYAMEDNAALYKTWHDNWCKPSLVKAISGTHTDLAELLYKTNWLSYICTHNGNTVFWYRFDDNKWTKNPNGCDLKKSISNDLVSKFIYMKKDIDLQIPLMNIHDQDTADMIGVKIAKLLIQLKTVPFKKNILEDSVEFFKKSNLSELFDDDAELLGVPSGVICASKKEIHIRKARPEDYLTRQTKADYDMTLSWNSPSVQDVLDWSGKTFTMPGLETYFWKFMASILRGGNNDKRFIVWSGPLGNNGKSTWVKAIELTLGKYCIKIPLGVVTSGGGNGQGPSPATARIKATRISFLEEPDAKVPIKEHVIKSMTGGDSFYTRNPYEEGGEVRPDQKTALICNIIPPIPPGQAMINRLGVMPFSNVWDAHAPKSIDEQYAKGHFICDPFFDVKIPLMTKALLWIMVHKYPKYASEGLGEGPSSAKSATKEFWDNSDPFALFEHEKIMKADSKSKGCDLNSIYEEYKLWFKSSFPGLPIPFKPAFKSELTKRWGPPIGDGWSAFMLKP